MEIKNVGLIGGRGYVGQEILVLLEDHQYIEVTSVFSSSKKDESVNGHSKNSSLKYLDINISDLKLTNEDAFILALPDGQSQPYVDAIIKHNPNAIIIDLSSDHRFDSDWQYRVPEIFGSINSCLISNPGCYSTAMQFMLFPLVDLLGGNASFFGISGYSGAGASPNPRNNTKLLKENILAYSLIGHKHEEEVKKYSYPGIFFSPHVAEFFRGILITGHFTLLESIASEVIIKRFRNSYKDHELIYIQNEAPHLQQVRGTSNVIIGGFEVDPETNRLTFCCVLDNLLKGAATQAIQNLNNAFGWNDNLGIIKE